MTVVTTWEAVPGRLRLLFTMVAEAGPVTREKLQGLTLHVSRGQRRAPQDGEGSGGSRLFTEPLREAINLGIMYEADGKIYVRAELPKRVPGSDVFVACVEDVLLRPNLNSSDQTDVASALSWLLTRPVAPGLEFGGDSRRQIAKDLDLEDGQTEWGIRNDAIFQNLIYWARFFGLATGLNLGRDRRVVPDPTVAIGRHLDEVLPEGRMLPIESFLRAIATHLPVLEFGTIRETVESRLRAEARRPEHAVSGSTSLALRRLRQAGAIRLEARSDAAMMLVDGDRFSHVERLGGTARG